MDPVFWILLVGIIILGGGTLLNNYLDKRKAIQSRPLKKNLSSKDWDDEWLEAQAKKHYIIKIEPRKLVFTFGKVTKELPTHDGFRGICNCGHNNLGIDLAMLERRFENHRKQEHEKALAEIGRFK